MSGRAHDFHPDLHFGRSIGNLAPPDPARASVARVLIGHSSAGNGKSRLHTSMLPGIAGIQDRDKPPARLNLRPGSGFM
jgi:hypothetical protein